MKRDQKRRDDGSHAVGVSFWGMNWERREAWLRPICFVYATIVIGFVVFSIIDLLLTFTF